MSVVILKPDEIGDFVIATGAIRLLAREHGEENTTLVVKSELAALAQREFPRSRIVPLPWQRRRKGHNTTFANMQRCFPAWRVLRATSADLVVFLRSQRNYLQTLFFASPRAVAYLAPENVLLRNKQRRRIFAEKLLRFSRRPELVPYPEPQPGWTAELEAHRTVVGAALGRDVSREDVMPSLVSATWTGGGDWLLCPFSSSASKDYDAERWAQALSGVLSSRPRCVIRLAGGPDQTEKLAAFAGVLREAGLAVAVEPPRPLEKFPDLVASSSVVLTVDTAAAHFACAVGAPAVVIASGLNDGVYGPYSPNGRQIWLTGDRDNLGSKRWRESVPPPMVAESIERALSA